MALPATAAITFDAASTKSGTSVSSLSWSHTVGAGNDRMLVVGVATESTPDRTATAVTFGGMPLTKVVGSRAVFTGSTPFNAAELWYLPAPAVGTGTIGITFDAAISASNGTDCGAISLFGVKQSGPEAVAIASANSTAAATPYSLAITTLTPGAWLVDVVNNGTANASFTPTAAGMTERWDTAVSAAMVSACATREIAVAGTVTDTWTSTGISRRAQTIAAFATAESAGDPPAVALTSPLSGDPFDAPATVNLAADASDSDGTIVKVEFFADGTKLGEDSTAPYTFTWTGVISGGYSLTAKATDSSANITTSASVAITVTNADNLPPSVAITSPLDGSSIAAGSSLNITASASDTDGVVAKVEFYQGAVKLGEDASAPFSYAWSNVPLGSHSLTAVATDNDAATTTSAPIGVTAEAAPWSYAQNFDGLGTAGTSIAALAGWDAGHFNPSVQQGTTGGNGLTKVTDPLTVDNGSAGTGGSPFLFNMGSTGSNDRALGSFARTTPAGDHFMQVAILNDSGGPISSFNLTYKGEEWKSSSTPVQQLSMWFGNTNATSGFVSMGSAFTFSTPNNTGSNVALDGNAPGNSTVVSGTYVPPSPIPNGSTFYLRWYDINDNGIADDFLAIDDLSINIPIGQSPTITLTGPANGSVHYLGGTINLTATASDSDGTISKVGFYQGTTKLGEDSTAPYTYDWTGYGIGSYSLTAKATDNQGNITTSAAAAIQVYSTPGSGSLTRGPYLNSGSHNQIVIRWRSSQSVVGRVRFGTSSGNLNQTANEASAKSDHEVKLTGLAPYTRYYYSVGSAFDTLTPQVAETTSFTPGAPAPTAADYTFRTSPVPGTAVNTRVWIVGDCGRGTQVQANGRNAYYSYNGSPSFTGSRIPDLNLQMGDNAYNNGTDAEYQTGYFNMYANIFRKMPQWSTLGNHDANNGDTNPLSKHPYFDMFTFPTAGECGGESSGTEHYYSFNYGNIHFICLDSQASMTTVDNPLTTGVNEDEQMAIWLRSDLASNTATWTIAFWHHPPYSKGSHNSDSSSQLITMRSNFNPIMEQGGVDLIYTGHSHNYERSVLLDGHYGTSGTITAAMKKNSGNGSITGFTTTSGGKIRNAANGFTATATVNGAVIPADGAYIKPLTGPRDHFGAVYNTAGMSGLADSGIIDHTAMYVSYNNVGTVNLDVNGTTLTATFVQSGGATPDNFTIIKRGAADTDGDGISDEYEIANGLNRYANDAYGTGGDSDGLVNLLEFAFGLNPSLNDATAADVDVPGLVLNQRGTPTLWYPANPSATDFEAVFIRRKQATEEGLRYIVQFSGDLVNWEDSAVIPTVIATSGEVEAVSVRYPLFAAGLNARFFRVHVTTGNY